ncbi:MAG: caspase family protein, partial [Bacteroidota bacterium]|nr:caspase family protein [Bacteroidota bacterium]
MSRGNKMLIIGIDKVKGAPHKDLSNARKGAEQVMSVLEAKYGFVNLGASPLLDEQATRQSIFQALDELVDASRLAKDPIAHNLVIYYAGHGDKLPKSKSGYWVCYDGLHDRSVRISFNDIIDMISE